MRPISYTEQEKGVVHFIYDSVKFREWNALGKQDGNVGCLLIEQNYNTLFATYLSYGTIENPNRNRFTVQIQHSELFDGEFSPPEKIINFVPRQSTNSYRMTFLTFN